MAILRQEQVPLRAYTTLKTGGFAQYLIGVHTTKELEEALMFATAKQLPYLILGGGSNLLVGDAGFPGVVIKIEQKGIEYTDVPHEENYVWLTAQAGECLDEVIEGSVARDLWGLENLSAIPGTVGATPVQNVGAYGVEVSDRIVSVRTYHVPTKTEKVFSNNTGRVLVMKQKELIGIVSKTDILNYIRMIWSIHIRTSSDKSSELHAINLIQWLVFLVFNYKADRAIERAVAGRAIGTLVSE